MDWKILFEAAASGNVNFLSRTVLRESDLEQVTPGQKNTLLHIAVNSKQKEFAEEVLHLCPSLLLRANIKGDTALHVAARTGSLELAQLLINTAKTTLDDHLHDLQDVESQQPELALLNVLKKLLRMVNLEKKETALHVAVKSGHFDVAKLLMKEDVGLLDLVNYLDESPMYLAVLGGFSNILLHILQTYPSSPCGGTNGINALHATVSKVSKQDHGITKILVEKRPELIKEVDRYERTPFHCAACLGDPEAIRLLLQCDTSAAYISDKDKMSPLHIAAYFGNVDTVHELIQYCPYIWELLDEKGQTALHVSVIAANEKMVKYILKVPELVGLINEPDKQGNTPLHLAAVYEKHTIISILARDKRVDKNARNNNSFTAEDIFHSKGPIKISFAVLIAHYLLKRTHGPSYLQQVLDTRLREGMKRSEGNSLENVDGLNEKMRSKYEAYLVVAILIATVTFAAAFTMPGGYKTDKGTAVSIHKAAFKAFIIFDTTAFCLSASAVHLLFYSNPAGIQRRPNYFPTATALIFEAMLAMVLAFVTGLHVMLTDSLGLVIAAYAMVGIPVIVFFIHWFCDPLGYSISGFKKPLKYFRDKLLDYGMKLFYFQ